LWVHDKWSFVAMNAFALASMVLCVLTLMHAHVRGIRFAFLCILGLTPLIISALIPIARNFAMVDTGSWVAHSLVIGGALEMLALFALMLVRTGDQREARTRLQALSHRDPLTGAKDARLMLIDLHQTLQRCEQLNQRCVLMSVVLENWQWFVKEHGTESAERALSLTSSAIWVSLRDIDSVGRMDRAEFAVLLEGPVDAADALRVATLIIAKSLSPSDALPIGAQLKLNIGLALLPRRDVGVPAEGDEADQSAQGVWSSLRAQHHSRLGERKRIHALSL
jgi:GGDEF domain-containing protein